MDFNKNRAIIIQISQKQKGLVSHYRAVEFRPRAGVGAAAVAVKMQMIDPEYRVRIQVEFAQVAYKAWPG